MLIAAHLGIVLVLLAGIPAPANPDVVVDLSARPNPSVGAVPADTDLTVRNAGPLPVHRVRAGIELFGDRRLDAAAGGDCTAVGSVRAERGREPTAQPWNIVCDVGTLAPGATSTVTVRSSSYGAGWSIASGWAGSDGEEPHRAWVLLMTRWFPAAEATG